jgi:transcriptional regulator with XRE-family HTH domain
MSIEALANECGIDYSQVLRMELGKVNFSISYLYKIAGVLRVDAKDLLP